MSEKILQTSKQIMDKKERFSKRLKRPRQQFEYLVKITYCNKIARKENQVSASSSNFKLKNTLF